MINFGVNSQEIDNFENVTNLTIIEDNAEMNATEPKSERCKGKVRTYVYDFVEEKFNEVSLILKFFLQTICKNTLYFPKTSPKMEANIMNATRYLLDQEILPEQTSTLNQYIDEKMADVESRFNEALLQKDRKIMELENALTVCKLLTFKNFLSVIFLCMISGFGDHGQHSCNIFGCSKNISKRYR